MAFAPVCEQVVQCARMSTSAEIYDTSDPIIARLEDQIQWYDVKSMGNQRAFRRIKVTEIVAAALIPLLSGFKIRGADYVGYAIAGLGVLITVLEGLLHLNQYQQNWIAYRSTCEGLKHEKYTFLAHAAPYANVADPRALLAERIESLVSQEHAKWASVQQQEVGTSGTSSRKNE